MGRKKNVLAIIPARAGSKGIKNKNIKPLLGKPLIGWVLEEAAKSKEIDEVIVSTDSPKIAKVAQRYGAKTPFLRPKRMAFDSVSGLVPLIHALRFYRDNIAIPDIAVCLQCTCPLTRAEDIDNAIKIFKKGNFDAVASVCNVDESPYWMVGADSKNRIRPLFGIKKMHTNRQDLPPAYRLNGAIFIFKPDILLKKGYWFTHNTGAYIMDKDTSFDIDTMEDFRKVEGYIKKNISKYRKRLER